MTKDNKGVIEKVIDSDVGLGLPDPVQKGLLKAANRLLGSILDIGDAYLDGFAQDRRATTEARKLLRIKAAESMSVNFKSDSPIANRAFAKNASKILGEQVNIEDILGIAIEDVAKNGKGASGGDINEDWFNAFEAEACKKSSEEMKNVYGRILSGEIQKPGTFSLSTVRALGTMGSNVASSFRRFCSIATALETVDCRVIAVEGNAASNKLKRFGFSYSDLNVLKEFGLISSDFSSRMPYEKIVELKIALNYAGKKFILIKDGEADPAFQATGVALTQIGREIYRIIDMVENTEYTIALEKHYKNNRLKMQFI